MMKALAHQTSSCCVCGYLTAEGKCFALFKNFINMALPSSEIFSKKKVKKENEKKEIVLNEMEF